MKYIVLPLLLASVAMAANVAMNIGGGGYNFGYHTGDQGGHSRSESGSAGNVAGSYSYIDANGDPRHVSYTAGPDGFKASGDIGVDRRTAAAAAQIAALAPKAPIPAPAVAHVPVAPYYGGYHYGAPAGIVNIIPGGYVAKW